METKDILREALALRNMGRLAEAERKVAYLARRVPTEGSVAGIIATIYWEGGKFSKAAQWFAHAVRLAPTSEMASLGLFHSLMQRGRSHAAYAEMRRFMA